MKIISIKNWCDENLTPLAWQRVVIKNLDALKSTGLTLTDLSQPSDQMELNENLVELVKQTIKDLYQVEAPIHVLSQ